MFNGSFKPGQVSWASPDQSRLACADAFATRRSIMARHMMNGAYMIGCGYVLLWLALTHRSGALSCAWA